MRKWGSYGSVNGQFNGNEGIAVDSSGYVYVGDIRNSRIQKFTSDGSFVTTWGSEGTGDGEFDEPYGIAVDSSGYVYVSDSYNNRIQKFRLTVPTPTPSGGGGGSSAAVAASSNIKAGESVVMNLKKGDSALTDVVVTVNEDVSTILVTAEKTALPGKIEAPENNVYQYIEVTLYKVTDASIDQAIFDFDVTKSWLDQNGYGIGDIVMMRYHDGAWQQLPTEFVKEQRGMVVYRAVGPGLSYFAIAYEEGGAVMTAEETPVIPVPTTAVPTATPTTAPTTVATSAVPTAATPAPGFAAAGALAGLGAAAFIVMRRR